MGKRISNLFEMEKQVVKGEEVDHDPVEHGVELINIISFQLVEWQKLLTMILREIQTFLNFI